MKAYIILLVCSQFVCLYSLTLRRIGHHGWFDLNFGIVLIIFIPPVLKIGSFDFCLLIADFVILFFIVPETGLRRINRLGQRNVRGNGKLIKFYSHI